MTASDVSAITKPWEVQKKVSLNVVLSSHAYQIICLSHH